MNKTDILKRLLALKENIKKVEGDVRQDLWFEIAPLAQDLWNDLEEMAAIGEATITKLEDAFDKGYQEGRESSESGKEIALRLKISAFISKEKYEIEVNTDRNVEELIGDKAIEALLNRLIDVLRGEDRAMHIKGLTDCDSKCEHKEKESN